MKRNIFILLTVASILIVFSTLIFASGTIDESLPSLIKRIKPSTVMIFTYDDKGEFLKLGSGFFVSQNGDVITNYHVIQGASFAEINTVDGKTYPITYILAGDGQNDLIRLSVNIPSQDVYPVSLSKTIPEVGEKIIVYGSPIVYSSPLRWENTVSDGIVLAIRDIPNYRRIIQITAPISRGSSDSLVLNLQGEVIGISTFRMIEGQNLNFAIPSEKISSLNLTEENKISITEEVFGPESKAKKDSEYYEAYKKALYFMENDEDEKALPYLEIVIKTDISPLKEDAYFLIGLCNDNLGNHVKTIEAYQQAIGIDPNNDNAYFNLGCVYDSLGLYNDAIKAYKQAIRIDPNIDMFYFDLGEVYDNLELYKEAIEAYKQVIRIVPDFTNTYKTNTYNHLGNSYYSLGLYKEAIEAYKQAIRINPDYDYNKKYLVDAYNNLGNSYAHLGLHEDAIEACKQAIRIDPDDANPHFVLGSSYFLIGDKSSALNEYKILKNLDINLANELFDLIY